MIGNFPTILNFDRSFLKLNRFICNQLPVLPLSMVQGGVYYPTLPLVDSYLPTYLPSFSPVK